MDVRGRPSSVVGKPEWPRKTHQLNVLGVAINFRASRLTEGIG